MVRMGVVDWPDGLEPGSAQWRSALDEIEAAAPDLLITNEMPFGRWLAASDTYDDALAEAAVRASQLGVDALSACPAGAVISSRIVHQGDRLANEAVLISRGQVRGYHRKQRFPQEPGFYEGSWFEAGNDRYPIVEAGGLRVGTLLCSELMYPELARDYGRAGAHLIAVPRATSGSFIWRAAAQMAAIVSGCFVATSNRRSRGRRQPRFGGGAFVYRPDGRLARPIGRHRSLQVFEIDPVAALEQRRRYPCYMG